MKKCRMFLIILAALFFLTGCGKKASDDFKETLEQQNEMNGSDFTLKMKTIEFGDTENISSIIAGAMGDRLKSAVITGENIIDSKNETADTNLSMDLSDYQLPMHFITDLKKGNMYLEATYLIEILKIAASLNDMNAEDFYDFSNIEGKYIEATAEEEADELSMESPEETTESGYDFAEMRSIFSKEYFYGYLGTRGNDAFKVTKETMSYTFNSKSFKEFLSYVSDEGDERQKIIATEMLKELATNEGLIDMNIKMTLNKAKNSAKIDFKFSTDETDTAIRKIAGTLNLKYKDSKKTVKLPKDDEIITGQEVESDLEEQQGGDQYMSEEDFQEIYDYVSQYQAAITPEIAQQILEEYAPYLTEEQLARLESLLQGQIAA
ncbi:LptM family lipoprotein [Enterococcus sp. AZ103]|uniref:LptM family lipoprotein n=1 Tax=Enterococcus sp. AZ103 TaxID=2774628 RepID=UPI003F211434